MNNKWQYENETTLYDYSSPRTVCDVRHTQQPSYLTTLYGSQQLRAEHTNQHYLYDSW